MNEVEGESMNYVRFPDDLYKHLRLRCAEVDSNIQAYVNEILKRALVRAQSALAAVGARRAGRAAGRVNR